MSDTHLLDGVNIEFSPSEKQYKAWQRLNDDVTRYIGYGGAAFGGKSYLECKWITAQCCAYPNVAYGLGRNELTTLRKTTLMTLFKVFEEANIKNELHYNYNQKDNVITFKNGSQIFLIDMARKPSDPFYQRLGGYELTGAAVDESAEVDAKAIEILATRCGRRNNQKYGLKAKILETFNPDKGHVYTRYYKPWKEGKLGEEYAFIRALPTDNPSPEAAEYVRDLLLSPDKITVERLVYGNFEYDDDPTCLMRFDAINDIFTNTLTETEPNVYMTVDVARYGGDSIVFNVWSGMKSIRRVRKQKQPLDETARDLRDLAVEYKVPYSRIIVDEDGVGGGVVDMCRGVRGFMGASTPLKNPLTGIVENYQNLRAQCLYKLAEVINTHELAVDCTDTDERTALIEELEQVKSRDLDKDGKLKVIAKEDIKNKIGRSPDICDTFMMRMWFTLIESRVQQTVKPIIHLKYLNTPRINTGNNSNTSYA
jgi:hypothetical protein